MSHSAGTTIGGIGSGSPKGGAHGNMGCVGRGIFQSVLRKARGGRANGAEGIDLGGCGIPGGGGTPGGGGGTAIIPGGMTGSGRNTVSGTGGGNGTTSGCTRPRIPARRAGNCSRSRRKRKEGAPGRACLVSKTRYIVEPLTLQSV